MKFRNGFVSNSSSSSFMITITKKKSNELNKVFDYPSQDNLTYEECNVLRTIEDVLKYYTSDCFDDSCYILKEIKYNMEEKMLEFITISVETFNRRMDDEIFFWEGQQKQIEKHLLCFKKDSEEYDYYLEESERTKETISFYKKYKAGGIEKIVTSKEYADMKEFLMNYINIIETQDIWHVVFRRDGEAPQSKLEQKIALMSEKDFKKYLKQEYDIDVVAIEKSNN